MNIFKVDMIESASLRNEDSDLIQGNFVK